VVDDSAVALPPLNMILARYLIDRTRVAALLLGYRDRPAVDMDTLCLTLMQVSQLIVDRPEIVEIDINPLPVDADGVLALDARVRVAEPGLSRQLAIRPYPEALAEAVVLDSGRVFTLRPIRPEDEAAHRAFLSQLAPDDIRFRFFGLVRDLPHSQMARLTQIDFDREMAFIAVDDTAEDATQTVGVVRTITDPNNDRCEFAIIVRSDIKGQGLGEILLRKMIRYCRDRGTQQMVGQILPDNRAMLDLAELLGFKCRTLRDDRVVEVVLNLQG